MELTPTQRRSAITRARAHLTQALANLDKLHTDNMATRTLTDEARQVATIATRVEDDLALLKEMDV